MFKSLMFGLGAGFLGLAAAATTPVIVGILAAMGGAGTIVGLGAFRAFRKAQQRRRRDREQERLAFDVETGRVRPA